MPKNLVYINITNLEAVLEGTSLGWGALQVVFRDLRGQVVTGLQAPLDPDVGVSAEILK